MARAVGAYRSALEVRTHEDLPQDWAQSQNNLGNALSMLGHRLEGIERLQRLQESVEAFRELVVYQPSDQSRLTLANALGNFAFDLILDRQFADAEARCREGQGLVEKIGDGIQKDERDNLIFIQQNLAHALLFQGHYDEALAIYCENWSKPLRGRTFGEITVEDFAAFDKAGLPRRDLSRIKQALTKSKSGASRQ